MKNVHDVLDEIGRVSIFIYLGDVLDAGGGCLSSLTAQVLTDWRKFRKLSAILCGQKWPVNMNGKLYEA